MIELSEQELKQEALDAAKSGRLNYLNILLGVGPRLRKWVRNEVRNRNIIREQVTLLQKYAEVLEGMIALVRDVDSTLTPERHAELLDIYQTKLSEKLLATIPRLPAVIQENPSTLISRALGAGRLSNEYANSLLNLFFPSDTLAMSGTSPYWNNESPYEFDQIRRTHLEHRIAGQVAKLKKHLEKYRAPKTSQVLIEYQTRIRTILEHESTGLKEELRRREGDVIAQVISFTSIYKRKAAHWVFTKWNDFDIEKLHDRTTDMNGAGVSAETVSRDRAETDASARTGDSTKSRSEEEKFSPFLREKFQPLHNARVTLLGYTLERVNNIQSYWIHPLAHVLMRANIDINTVDGDGVSLLAHATINRDYDMVRDLLEGNADMDLPDICGKTPRQLAIESQDPLMIALFAMYKDLVLNWPYLPELDTFINVMRSPLPDYARTLERQAGAFLRYQEERERTSTLWESVIDLFQDAANDENAKKFANEWVTASKEARLSGNYERLHTLVNNTLRSVRTSILPNSLSKLNRMVAPAEQIYASVPNDQKGTELMLVHMREQERLLQTRQLQTRIGELEATETKLLEEIGRSRQTETRLLEEVGRNQQTIAQQAGEIVEMRRDNQALQQKMQRLEEMILSVLAQKNVVDNPPAPIEAAGAPFVQ